MLQISQLYENLDKIFFEANFLNEFVNEFSFLHNIDKSLTKILLYSFLGNAIADKVILNPTIDQNYFISTNIWTVIILPPGSKKSVFLEFFKNIYGNSKQFLDIATKEAIIEEMKKIKHGIFAIDELSLLLNKIKKDAEYRSFVLTGWNGYSEITKKTITRKNFNETVSFGIIGNIQPDLFLKLMLKDNLNDGLIERFQFLYFNPNYNNIITMYTINENIINNLKSLFEFLNSNELNLLLQTHKQFKNRFIIKATEKAQKLFINFINILRLTFKNENNNNLLAFMGKIDKVVGTIALIHAVLRGINTNKFEVREQDIYKGAIFAKYVLNQFFKIEKYFMSDNKKCKEGLKYKVIRKIVQKRSITKRELIQQVANLKTIDDVNKILEELKKDGIQLKIEKNQITI
jgi:hypothetical protein